MTKEPSHSFAIEDGPRISDWLRNRGGLFLWLSVDLCEPGKSWMTPALTEQGDPTPKPSWQAASEPAFHLTDSSDIELIRLKEVERFGIKTRLGSQGIRVKVTDASSRRIQRRLRHHQKVHPNRLVTYRFDYVTQEAVLEIEDDTILLTEWMKQESERNESHASE